MCKHLLTWSIHNHLICHKLTCTFCYWFLLIVLLALAIGLLCQGSSKILNGRFGAFSFGLVLLGGFFFFIHVRKVGRVGRLFVVVLEP